MGEVTHLAGTVLGTNGQPLRNAVVEIWQADQGGCYLHSESGNKPRQDKNVQGFGRFLTGANGEYYFRTIKPVAYPGRAPHILLAVNHNGQRILTTQCYIKGHVGNKKDRLLNRTRDARARKSLLVDFAPPAEDSDR